MSDEKAGFLREALFNGNGVAKKLIVALVLFSSLVTAVITALELYADYRRGLGQINRSIDFIGTSYLPALADAVWVTDRAQLRTQLDGLLRLPDLEFIGIAVDGQTRWAAGAEASHRTIVAEIPLLREHRGQALMIGTVRVVGSIDRVLERLWNQLLVTLLSNAVKTLLVALFMLLVFQYMVTRHLTRIAAFVRRIDPAAPRGEQVQLDRPVRGRWRPDILDAVTTAINALSASLGAAVAELRGSDERLRALTRESSALIYELDAQGVINFANRTSSGLTRAQVEGSLLVDWFAPDLRQHIGQAVTAAFTTAAPQRLEYTLTNPDGEPRAYMASIVPIVRDGVVASAVLTALDISEQKAAEQAIRELNTSLEARVRERTAQLQQAMERTEAASRSKSEFLSRMSHELRTPMNAILGFAQIIEMSEPSARQLKWAGEIRRAGEHLLQMIEELLDLSRIEAGKMAIKLEVLDLLPLIDECVAIVQPLAAARGLGVTQDCPTTHAWVLADRLRLRQVLVNLLSNAVKYNREHGAIHIRCERRADHMRLSVADRGAGLGPEQMARLFQPFERLGAELGDVQGTGIGLSLSKQLAELMGAKLGAHSAVGEGSEFWIDLRPAGDVAGAASTVIPAPVPLDRLTFDILYIEDNAANVELMAAFLARYPNVRLRTALSGDTGLALARERRPDVVLLDIHLPGMDGYQVLQALRGDTQLRDVAVIALSADAMPHDIERGLFAGFDRYLAKPVDLQGLLGSIDDVLRARTIRPLRF